MTMDKIFGQNKKNQGKLDETRKRSHLLFRNVHYYLQNFVSEGYTEH